ncbi:Ribonuclease H-like superfamily [Sesbania bispinosa]|nr:Ribonuclease H-like superfamily [Sesbania bispinosa]
MPSFWNDVVYSLKAMRPLVRVLRLVDNEKNPAMGYIYEAMDKAKEAIQKSFNENEDKYKEIFVIIDRRWECQLHHPLHSTGHFLNHEYFCGNQRIDLDPEVMGGLYKCIERPSENEEVVDQISNELSIYKRAGGLFEMKATIRQRTKVDPGK